MLNSYSSSNKSKRKYDNSSNKRKRRSSLKNLSFIDEMPFAGRPVLKTKNNCEIAPLDGNNSQMELFSDLSASDLQIDKNEAIYFSNYQQEDINSCLKRTNPDIIEKKMWADHGVMPDIALLSYSTPLKTMKAKEDLGENLNPIYPIRDKVQVSESSFHDSWFEDVNFSLLEKENSQKNNIHLDLFPEDKMLLNEKKCCESFKINSNQSRLTESTPKSEKPKSDFRMRLRKTLAENARKTPQPQNTLLKFNDKESSQESNFGKNKYLVDDKDLSTQDIGPFYGLPSLVNTLLKKLRGISCLYDWQKDCLTRDEIKAGKNLVYTLPTSGGKTLVAEIIIMKTLLCLKKNAILVLPFVAIVQEKIQSLSQFAVDLGFLIEEYAGGKGRFPPRKRRKKNVLYVCTIEKANSLVNSLIETERLNEIKLLVVDELHMIGEGGKRGAIVESMLAKVLYLSESVSIQIIGMSATLSNSDELASFLRANVFCNDFRPVKLDEYVKVTDCVYKIDPSKLCADEKLTKERTLCQPTDGQAMDSDHLSSLVMEVVPDHSCLVFCPTKRNCENVALLICKFLSKKFMEHRQKEKSVVLKALKSDSGNICPTLRKVIPYGVAYHHSGLTSDERRIIEEAYRNGVLSTITCTSTLAAGVNLPARRVIIRSPHIGQNFMTRAQYKQMIGRAGRAGIDSKGESYLVVSKPEDQPRIYDLICGPVATCRSSLLFDGGRGFRSLLLSLISLKIVSKTSEALGFFNQTLCARQKEALSEFYSGYFGAPAKGNIKDDEEDTASRLVVAFLQHLVDLKLIEKIESFGESSFRPTTLGKATSKCGIDFDVTQKLFDDLKRGLESLVLENYLHLLYLITPYDAPSSVSPNWLIYMSEMNRLNGAELTASSVIGVPEQYIVRRASGNNPKRKKVDLRVIDRFYVTLMLYDLFKGRSVWEVSGRFEVPRGFLQGLLTSSASFASCVLRFAQEFEHFWPYQALLEKLIETLQYCRVSELVPLMEVTSVKLARAKQLHKAGYKSLAQLANADPDVLFQDIDLLSKKQARQIVSSAKALLAEKIDSLQEEMELLKSVDL